ncbi:hypothetical protein PanWU01x14_356140 [Parasponia andersonii]|uniref:Transmembrane protein n=1 Tax=Parasponia andersonii TaxID=3476 RepID=A0A2P5A924_PARAD|nr:hypothetical protein PanWU01x14_356140 [Parasponia andersonii]
MWIQCLIYILLPYIVVPIPVFSFSPCSSKVEQKRCRDQLIDARMPPHPTQHLLKSRIGGHHSIEQRTRRQRSWRRQDKRPYPNKALAPPLTSLSTIKPSQLAKLPVRLASSVQV